ncbi:MULTISPECIES: hypothetical protein [unclassified Flavobacterium]|uniref:hypothetical protein n=1 Tax=unclassified Flavobacterium TaxID=196869 RepID=UPI00131E8508|nr:MULTISPECIES: hypothetical protein [unclassified Flavobacterium]
MQFRAIVRRDISALSGARTFLQTLEKLDVAGQLIGKVFRVGGKFLKPILNPISKKIKFALAEGVQFAQRIEFKLPNNLYCGIPYLEIKLRDRLKALTANEIKKLEDDIARQLNDPNIPVDENGNKLLELDIDGEKVPAVVGTNEGLDKIDDGVGVNGVGKLGLLSKLDNFLNLKKWVYSLDDLADSRLISKLEDYITANPTKLQKLEAVLNAPVLKNQEWDNLEKVFDAFKKAEAKGLSVGHKKFPAVDDEGSGSFVLKNAKQYQAEASGDAALSLEKASTSWDNIDDAGKLIDRKYGHGTSVFNQVDDGFGGKIISVKNQTRANSIIEQATRQVNAAGGTQIKWEISTELGAKGIKKLFDESDNILLKNIEVVFIPQIKIIP